jgi:hypothetical protein
MLNSSCCVPDVALSTSFVDVSHLRQILAFSLTKALTAAARVSEARSCSSVPHAAWGFSHDSHQVQVVLAVPIARQLSKEGAWSFPSKS